MSKTRSTIKTKISEIIDYWITIEDECYLNFDWSEADEVCWRCGCTRKLQRCHIIPDSLGGKDLPSNFVLLCAECHQEAPNVESKEFMWDWIKSFHCPFYNTFWQQRAMDEYERIYKKSFLQELEERNIVTEHAAYKFWNLKTGKTSYHFGHPYGNVATITGNYKLHLEAFDKKYPHGKYLSDNGIEREKKFESLSHSICELAEKYNYSVWEGGSKNPYSLCISTLRPSIRNHTSVSIRLHRDGNYRMCISNDYNPNHIPIKCFTIPLGNDSTEILNSIEIEIKKLDALYGKAYTSNQFFMVASPYWSRKNTL